jgi:hypothetical protein
MLIFLVGALLGLITGGMLCARYVRREITDDIGPKLKRVQIQLDSIESAVNLAIVTRYTELSTHLPNDSAHQLPS